jgi:hypothetical protein
MSFLENIVEMIEYYISIVFDFFFEKNTENLNENNSTRNPIHSPHFETHQVYPCTENF